MNIGIKDPRISLTFPIWQKVLLSQGYTLKIILVFRSPGDFLRSNQQLLQHWEGWDAARHLHFWLQLNLAAIYFTRNYPVFFLNYDELTEQPLKVAKHLAEFFNLDAKQIPATATVLDRTRHHHQQLTPTGYSLIDHYYRLLGAHRLSGADYLSYRSSTLAATNSDQLKSIHSTQHLN